MNGLSLAAKGLQHDGAADGETGDGAERGEEQGVRAAVEEVGCDRGEGEDEAYDVQPKRSAHGDGEVFADLELKEERG